MNATLDIPNPNICPECGAVLPDEAPHGLCPSCLLRPDTGKDGTSVSTEPGLIEPVVPFVQAFTLEKPGDQIDRYKLLQKIGEGGCGIVYMAEQQVPVKRKVALKVIKLGMDTKAVIARLEAERQALALMDHPNIAKVLDGGATSMGRPYFVMELVRGVPITRYCDKHRLGPRQRLELFIRVCQAIQHAHQKGIIHRDLKPTNILVADHDGTPVPKVIDFGIAKATAGQTLTDKTLFTAFEQFIGTPAYMSPEQAQLSGLDIDTRSDIYSLGVLLYELLTGRTPFDPKRLAQAGFDEIRRIIREEDPVRPSTRLSTLALPERGSVAHERGCQAPRLIGLIRGDLDWIAMKTLEKDRNRRYETASGLARDLRRHLDCEPVLARPPSRLYEFRKTVRRHKLGFASAAAVVAVLSAGVLASTWQAVQKERERQRFQRNVVRQYVANGTRKVNESDLFGSLLWYAEALRLDAGDPRREEAHRIRIASVLRQCPKLLNLFAHGRMLFHAEFSRDGAQVVTASDDHTARTWDSVTGRHLLVLRHEGEVYDAAFSADGRWIVTSSQDHSARIWDGQTGELKCSLPHRDLVWRSCFSSDGRLVATACRDKTAQLWDTATGQRLGAPLAHEDAVEGVNFSPDGKLLATVTAGGSARVWDVATREERFRGSHTAGELSKVEFAPDGSQFITCGPELHVYDAHSFRALGFSPLKRQDLYAAHFSPDGRSLVATSSDFSAQVWDAASGQPRFASPVRHTGPVLNAAIAPDGRYFATAGQDAMAQVWNSDTGQPLGPPLKFILPVKYIQFNADGRRLLGNSNDQAARVWDLATGDLPGPPRPAFGNDHRTISADGRYVLLQGQSNVVWIVDSRTGRRLVALPHSDPITYASFSRDGRSVITACERPTAVSSMANDLFLWGVPTGRRLNAVPMRHPFALMYAAFSPDNRRLLTCGFDFTARLWNARTGEPLSEPLRHREQIRWGAFSPDGRSVVTTSWDRTARVWDAATGTPLTPPLQHKAAVVGALWSGDGRHLQTLTTEAYLQVWDLATGEPLTPPRKVQDPVEPSPDPSQPAGVAAHEDLARDDRPVADLVLLAQMLAVGRIDPSGNEVPLEPKELTESWRVLHEKYPRQFAATPAEAAAWHCREAEASQEDGKVSAAKFHLDRALQVSPRDHLLAEKRRRLAALNSGLNSGPALAEAVRRFLERDPAAGPDQVDLAPSYNLSLHREDANDFGDLPEGLLALGGLQFDVRGAIHLGGREARNAGMTFPERVTGIKVGRKCRRLHFLQGASWVAENGAEVGQYVLHYADGGQACLPILFGRDLGDWWCVPEAKELDGPACAVRVWWGNNLAAAKFDLRICLYCSTRENPRPEVPLDSIDFVSSMSPCAPFLVAFTLDGAPGTPRPVPTSRPAGRFPPRDPEAGPAQIDLSSSYNRPLYRSDGLDFGDLQAGMHTLGGVPFDVRGVIGLGDNSSGRVNRILVGRKCRRLHFLHGTEGDAARGTTVGHYVLHYADGGQSDLPITLGQDTGPWWLSGLPPAPDTPDGAVPVWSGKNRRNQIDGGWLYLYKSTRQNPRPEVDLVSVDLVSTMSPAAPFLVALTVE